MSIIYHMDRQYNIFITEAQSVPSFACNVNATRDLMTRYQVSKLHVGVRRRSRKTISSQLKQSSSLVNAALSLLHIKYGHRKTTKSEAVIEVRGLILLSTINLNYYFVFLYLLLVLFYSTFNLYNAEVMTSRLVQSAFISSISFPHPQTARLQRSSC